MKLFCEEVNFCNKPKSSRHDAYLTIRNLVERKLVPPIWIDQYMRINRRQRQIEKAPTRERRG